MVSARRGGGGGGGGGVGVWLSSLRAETNHSVTLGPARIQPCLELRLEPFSERDSTGAFAERLDFSNSPPLSTCRAGAFARDRSPRNVSPRSPRRGAIDGGRVERLSRSSGSMGMDGERV